MMTVFSFLFLISLIILIVGLIKPSFFWRNEDDKQKITRKTLGLTFGFFALLFFILIGIMAKPVDKTKVKSEKVQISKTPKPSPTEKPKATPTTSSPTKINSPTPTSKIKSNSDEILVTKVVDGDTIQIEGGKVVRYIGIDTPETVDPRQSVQCFGKEASDKNKGLVAGKKVRLVKDVSETDRYGRLLRYVYVGDIFVNDYLVRKGYAYASSYPPDVKYQKQFNEAQTEARVNSRGLWGSCNNTTSVPTNISTTSNSDTGNYTCSGKTKCGEMSSCSEAYFYLNSCSIKSLDGDKDGIPCETLCN